MSDDQDSVSVRVRTLAAKGVVTLSIGEITVHLTAEAARAIAANLCEHSLNLLPRTGMI